GFRVHQRLLHAATAGREVTEATALGSIGPRWARQSDRRRVTAKRVSEWRVRGDRLPIRFRVAADLRIAQTPSCNEREHGFLFVGTCDHSLERQEPRHWPDQGS